MTVMTQVKRRQSDDLAITQVKRLSLVKTATGGRQGRSLGRHQYALVIGDECRRTRRGLRAWHGRNGIVRNLGGPQMSSLVMRYAGDRHIRRKAKSSLGVGLTDSTLSVGKPHTWGSGEQYVHKLEGNMNLTQRRNNS